MTDDLLRCTNCGAVMGPKAQAHLHNGKVVCADCAGILAIADKKPLRKAAPVPPRAATPAGDAGRPLTVGDGMRLALGFVIVGAIASAGCLFLWCVWRVLSEF